MKKKITLQLSSEILERLTSAAEKRCVNRAMVVERALEIFLAQPVDGTLPPQDRLGGVEQQLQGIQRDVQALNDTVALHARFHLAVTSLLGQDGTGAPKIRDRDVAEALQDDMIHRLQRDPGERRRQARPDRSLHVDEGSRQFGASIAEVSWGVPAAGEGGEDPFRFPPQSAR